MFHGKYALPAVGGGTLHHHRRGLEDGVRDLSHRELLVVGLLRRDDRGERREHEVDTRVRHQVGLELRDVDVQGTVVVVIMVVVMPWWW